MPSPASECPARSATSWIVATRSSSHLPALATLGHRGVRESVPANTFIGGAPGYAPTLGQVIYRVVISGHARRPLRGRSSAHSTSILRRPSMAIVKRGSAFPLESDRGTPLRTLALASLSDATPAVPCAGRAVLPVEDRPQRHVGVVPVPVAEGVAAQSASMRVPALRPHSRTSSGWTIAHRPRPKDRGGQQLSNTDRDWQLLNVTV